MAPGAMYVADTRAVLKITTRRNFVNGISLTDRAEVVSRRKWSANDALDANYHIGSWDIFASGLIARNNSRIKGTTTNSLIYDGKETVVGSSQRKNYPSTTGTVKAGFNYLSGTQSFGAYYRYNPERGHFSNIGQEWLDNDTRINRDIFTDIRSHSHLASAYYDNTFRENTYCILMETIEFLVWPTMRKRAIRMTIQPMLIQPTNANTHFGQENYIYPSPWRKETSL